MGKGMNSYRSLMVDLWRKELIIMDCLIRINKGKIFHYWDVEKQDTFCTMYSTGGLKKSLYSVVDIETIVNKRPCTMCNSNRRIKC